MNESKLNEKQQKFVEEYLFDKDPAAAAIRAGYSIELANNIGYGLLQEQAVKEYIEELKAKESKHANFSRDKFMHILFSALCVDTAGMYVYDGSGYVTAKPADKLTDDQRRVVTGIKKGRDGTFIYETISKERIIPTLARVLKLDEGETTVKGIPLEELAKSLGFGKKEDDVFPVDGDLL